MKIFLSFTHAWPVVLMLALSPARAVTLEKRLDAAQEVRAVALFKQIRCISCAGESVYDSRGRLAKDFRAVIRMKITEGVQDDAILQYFTERYGPQVLANPLPASNVFLWAAPMVFVAFGITGALFYRRYFR